MRSARLVEPGRLVCDEIPVPRPTSGQVLLRTLRASVCGSDVHTVYRGIGPAAYPCRHGYPGHEAVGEVVESTVTGFAVGQRLLAVPDSRVSAAYADYQAVPSRFLVPVDERLSIDQAVLAQQLGTVMFAMRRFWSGPPAACATVIGAGPVGLFFLQLLRNIGFEQLIVSDLEPARLAHATRLGATSTVPAGEASVSGATLDLTDGVGADLVIEAAGHDATRVEAVRTVAAGGRIGYFGLPERYEDVPFPLYALLGRKPTLVVAHGAQHEPGLRSFHSALSAIASGSVDVSSLITHSFGIDRIADAVELAADRSDGALKVAVDF